MERRLMEWGSVISAMESVILRIWSSEVRRGSGVFIWWEGW